MKRITMGERKKIYEGKCHVARISVYHNFYILHVVWYVILRYMLLYITCCEEHNCTSNEKLTIVKLILF